MNKQVKKVWTVDKSQCQLTGGDNHVPNFISDMHLITDMVDQMTQN